MALGCSLLWAGQGIAVKLATNELPPLRIVALRMALSAIALGTFAWLRGSSLRISKHGLKAVAWNAAFLSLQLLLYTRGTAGTSSVHSIVLINTFPFFAVVAGLFWLPELRASRTQLVALTLAFAGAVCVLWSKADNTEATRFTGDALVLLAAACMGWKIVFLKGVLADYPPLLVVFWTAILGLCVCGSLSLWLEPRGVWPNTTTAWAALLYQGWAVSALAFVLWNILLSRHAPNDVTAFRMVAPLVGAFLGWLLLQEAVGLNVWLGAILIVTATALSTWNSRKAAEVETATAPGT